MHSQIIRARLGLFRKRRGDQLIADVEGSSYEPYQVRVTIENDDIAGADCTCPYDWGGVCKHIVAALLVFIDGSEDVVERPTIENLLSDLDRNQLQALVSKLVAQQPELEDFIESYALALKTPLPDASSQSNSHHQRRTTLDSTPFRHHVHAALHSLDRMRPSEAYWHVGEVVDEVRQVLDQTHAYLEACDGDNALVILQALTEEYISEWTLIDDSNGEASGFFDELSIPWAEAILSADLTREDRQAWADRFSVWEAEVEQYGVEGCFDPAQAAALQGWDYPPLVRVLEEGQVTQKGAWEGEAPWYADELAVARLNVLARQDRTQEYLYLAEAEGQTKR